MKESFWESLIGNKRKKQPMKFKVICAWNRPGCTKIEEEGDLGAPTSHGICDNCASIWLEEEKMAL